ncbi:MAG: glycoside hydrolase family 97 N-terminal domain-containing protein, partial [Bacteroidota bacterium]
MKTIVVALLCCISPAGLYGQFLSVASPDANLLFTFFVEDAEEEQGCLFYSLSHRDKNVVRKSRLGIVTVDLPSWINGFTLVDHTQQSIDETWKPVYGERSTVRNRYNECTINLRKDNDKNNTFQVIIRVYNEGAAFCYSFPENLSTSVIHIKDEITQFVFEDGTIAYVTPFAQELYYAQPLQDWSYESTLPLPRWAPRTPDYESERPLALVLPNDLFAVIGEARLVDYSRMKFILSPEKTNTVGVRLFGPVTESSPFTTPWRVIMVAERPGDLI